MEQTSLPVQGKTTNKKRMLKIIGIALLTFLILFLLYFGYIFWRVKTGRLVKWEGQWYTKQQLAEKFGPQVYNVPSKNTPEEVYAKFREALLKEDMEGALNLITENHREDYRQAFKNKEKFDKWVKSLPEKLTKEREEGNYAYYDVDYGGKNKNSATFIKNADGYWQIDII